MGLKKEFEERVKDAEAKSHFISWKRRWWGKMIIGFIVILIFAFLLFLYLLFDSYINIKKGNIYSKKSRGWITMEQVEENRKIVGEFMTGDDPWLGTENPSIYIIGFESFGCPYCKDDQEGLRKMISTFGTAVKFVAKDFPTEELHNNVFNAHLAAACADDQGNYWDYRDLLFSNQGDHSKVNLKLLAKNLGLDLNKFDTQEVRQDYASGVQSGVIGTPSYIVNGQLISGAMSYEMWEELFSVIIKMGL